MPSSNVPKIDQAMILAAGKGTRMRPLTLHTPKPLIDVAGQPLIVWHILALKAAGILNICVNCSYLADNLIDALGDGSQFGVKLSWSIEDEPLETAGGIAKALADGHLQEAPFVLVNGDVWTTFDFSQLTSVQLNEHLGYLLLTPNPSHNESGDFYLQDGMAYADLVNIKDSSNIQKYTFAGVSVLCPELLAGVSSTEASPLAPLMMQAMSKNKMTATLIQDKWVDVGTPKRLDDVNKYVANELMEGDHRGRVLI